MVTVLQCVPSVEGSKELVNDLNCNNDLFKFVRIMREKFQAATICGTSCCLFSLRNYSHDREVPGLGVLLNMVHGSCIKNCFFNLMN